MTLDEAAKSETCGGLTKSMWECDSEDCKRDQAHVKNNKVSYEKKCMARFTDQPK